MVVKRKKHYLFHILLSIKYHTVVIVLTVTLNVFAKQKGGIEIIINYTG